jgi:hypothetical protein
MAVDPNSASDPPGGGGRVVLRRLEQAASRVVYRAEISEGEETRTFDVAVELPDGGLVLPPEIEGIPAFLQKVIKTTLRTLWRNHKTEGFPRRVARWRPER